MEPAFEDIRIVDLDTRRTTWSRVHESMRVVYLRLNRAPPDMEWPRLFHEERESRINPLRCGLWIEDDSISFDCLLGDVETVHIPDIQRSIDFANRRYREVLVKRESARRERHAETVSEADVLAAMRTRVRMAAPCRDRKPRAEIPDTHPHCCSRRHRALVGRGAGATPAGAARAVSRRSENQGDIPWRRLK